MDKVFLNRIISKQLKQAEFEKKRNDDSNIEKIIDNYIDILNKINNEINKTI